MTDLVRIQQVVKRLENEVYHVHSVQKTFENLFVSSAKSRELLHNSDAAVFHDLYIVYLNYVSIAVARLFDPAASFGRKNLSLFYLIDSLAEVSAESVDELRKQVAECKAIAYNFIEPRNQLIAHLDFEVNSGGDGKCIPSYLSREFDDVYARVATIMNAVRSRLDMPPSMFEWGITNHGHGRKLLHRLDCALKYSDARKAQL